MKDDRLTAIRQHLYSHGFSSVPDIAEAVGASQATIRRDLLALEAEGLVARTHGGARISKGSGIEVAFALREQENLAAKRAIADAAFERIKPHSTVFLDAGTTVLQLARRLRLDPMPLAVFTNGLVVAQTLMEIPGLSVTVIGGRLRAENASMVGAAAEAMIDRLWFDQLFLGAGAIADDARLYSLDENEARLNERMMARSAETIVLVDASKFGQRLTYLVTPLGPGFSVVTDSALPEDWRQRLDDIACEATIVSVPLAAAEEEA